MHFSKVKKRSTFNRTILIKRLCRIQDKSLGSLTQQQKGGKTSDKSEIGGRWIILYVIYWKLPRVNKTPNVTCGFSTAKVNVAQWWANFQVTFLNLLFHNGWLLFKILCQLASLVPLFFPQGRREGKINWLRVVLLLIHGWETEGDIWMEELNWRSDLGLKITHHHHQLEMMITPLTKCVLKKKTRTKIVLKKEKLKGSHLFQYYCSFPFSFFFFFEFVVTFFLSFFCPIESFVSILSAVYQFLSVKFCGIISKSKSILNSARKHSSQCQSSAASKTPQKRLTTLKRKWSQKTFLFRRENVRPGGLEVRCKPDAETAQGQLYRYSPDRTIQIKSYVFFVFAKDTRPVCGLWIVFGGFPMFCVGGVVVLLGKGPSSQLCSRWDE